MAKTHLLQVVCAAALLAAVPAFAQTNDKPADMGAGGKVTNPTAVPNGSSTAAPAEKMTDSSMHKHAAMHMKDATNTSQDAEVDRLNNQSYQAAQNGQTFNVMAPDKASSSTGSGTMSDMPMGSMPSKGTTGNNAK